MSEKKIIVDPDGTKREQQELILDDLEDNEPLDKEKLRKWFKEAEELLDDIEDHR